MDVGNDNGWDFSKVVTKDEMLTMIEQHFEIDPVEPKYFGEVGKYYRHKDNGVQFWFDYKCFTIILFYMYTGKAVIRWEVLRMFICNCRWI